MNNPLAFLNIDLNLEALSLKLQDMKAFMNFSLMGGILHCEHYGYNLDFYKNGKAVITLPVDPIVPDDFDEDLSFACCSSPKYLLHKEHNQVNLDDCLKLATELINNPLELN